METQNGPKFCIGKDNGFEHFKLKILLEIHKWKKEIREIFQCFYFKIYKR